MKNLPYVLFIVAVVVGTTFLVIYSQKREAAKKIENAQRKIDDSIFNAKYEKDYNARMKKDSLERLKNPKQESTSTYSRTDEYTPYTGSYEYDLFYFAKKVIPEFTKYPLETELDDKQYKIKSNGVYYQITGVGTSKNGFGVRVRFVYTFTAERYGSGFKLVTNPTISEM
jgi:hypothetical protein